MTLNIEKNVKIINYFNMDKKTDFPLCADDAIFEEKPDTIEEIQKKTYDRATILKFAIPLRQHSFVNYPNHISATEAIEGVTEGIYRTGVLKVPKSGRDAYVQHSDPTKHDYIAVGAMNQNRALHNDMVIFKILSPNEWVPVKRNKLPTDSDNSNVDKESNDLHESIQIVSIYKRHYTTDGVKYFVVTLRWPEFVSFPIATPIDPRFPEMAVHNYPVSKEKFIEDKSFHLVKFLKWKEICRTPLATYISKVSNLDENLKLYKKITLINNNLHKNYTEYSAKHLKEIEAIKHDFYLRKSEEAKCRTNFSEYCVFTVDPATAKDFDDAIHFVDRGSYYEVTVHIADVTHFVKENSQIDKIARERCVTVYFPDTAYHMLPSELSSNLCSLVPNEERYVISMTIKFSKETYEVIEEPKIEKGIIRSCARLTYEEVQEILDIFEQTEPSEVHEKLQKLSFSNKINHPKFTFLDLCSHVNILMIIAEKTPKSRKCFLQNLQRFFFNLPIQETYSFEDVVSLEDLHIASSRSHILIQEFMILANKFFAELLVKIAPEQAILRVHSRPSKLSIQKLFTVYFDMFRSLDFDGPTLEDKDESYEQYIAEVFKRANDQLEKLICYALFYQSTKHFEAAVYQIYANSKVEHYGLGLTYYTHFTSPIRRYSDIIAHRVLYAHKFNGSSVHAKDGELDKMCTDCTTTTLSSKEASSQINSIMYSLCLKNNNITDLSLGCVVCIKSEAIGVFIPKLSQVKFILYFRKKPSNSDVSDNFQFPVKVNFVADSEFSFYWRLDEQKFQETDENQTFDSEKAPSNIENKKGNAHLQIEKNPKIEPFLKEDTEKSMGEGSDESYVANPRDLDVEETDEFSEDETLKTLIEEELNKREMEKESEKYNQKEGLDDKDIRDNCFIQTGTLYSFFPVYIVSVTRNALPAVEAIAIPPYHEDFKRAISLSRSLSSRKAKHICELVDKAILKKSLNLDAKLLKKDYF